MIYEKIIKYYFIIVEKVDSVKKNIDKANI